MRFGAAGAGKRGGIRVLYLLREPTLYFVWVYDKSSFSDITQAQKRTLAAVVKELK
jgi:hypothetical protein